MLFNFTREQGLKKFEEKKCDPRTAFTPKTADPCSLPILSSSRVCLTCYLTADLNPCNKSTSSASPTCHLFRLKRIVTGRIVRGRIVTGPCTVTLSKATLPMGRRVMLAVLRFARRPPNCGGGATILGNPINHAQSSLPAHFSCPLPLLATCAPVLTTFPF